MNVSGDTTVETNEGFTVTLSNPTNATITTATATGTITNDDVVTNTPPVAVNDTFTTPQNTPLTKTVAELVSNDTDANGDALYISSFSPTSTQGGTLSPDDNGTPNNLFDDKGTYTPPTGFVGTDTFSYTVNDGKGGTSVGTVTVNVLPPANTAPVAVNDSFTTPQNTPLTKTVAELVSNDTDANGDALYISSFSPTSTQGGTVVSNDNGTPNNLFDDKGTYTPPTGFVGTDTFSYTVNDGKGGTSVGTVNVNVVAAPIIAIAPTNATQNEGNSGTTAFTFTATRAGDTTGASSANFAVTGSGANPSDAADFGGTFPSGTVTFAAGETSKVITVNVSGDTTVETNEGFTVTLSNPTNATITTATATGTITNDDVVAVNNAPTLANAIADQNAKQGTAFNFQVPTNTFADIDAGDVLTYSATLENGNALPTWLTFNSTTRTFSGTPTNDNVGNLNVKVAATDKAGASVNDIFVIAVEKIIDNQITTVGTIGDDKLIATPGTKFDGQNNIVFTGAGKDEVDLSTVSVFPNAGNNNIDTGSGDDTVFVNKGDRV